MEQIPEQIERYFNQDNKLKQWPSKRKDKLSVLEFLSEKFEQNKIYSEKEVNGILNQAHVFNDAPLLRRELFDNGFLDRTRDCRQYWKIRKEPEKL